MEVLSNGLEMAFFAASAVRCLPVAQPMPIKADPLLDMIVFTSAKSMLIKPGTAIKSDIPWILWRRTSSASRNASSMGVFLCKISNKRSFGITIMCPLLSSLRRFRLLLVLHAYGLPTQTKVLQRQ